MQKAIWLIFFGFTVAQSGFAGVQHFQLRCDDEDSDFENPMEIEHEDNGPQINAANIVDKTTGKISWDVGPDILNGTYDNLQITEKPVSRLVETKIIAMSIVDKPTDGMKFRLSLRAVNQKDKKGDRKYDYIGHVHAVSTDRDNLVYEGKVFCNIQQL
jgi:hypothetical protein